MSFNEHGILNQKESPSSAAAVHIYWIFFCINKTVLKKGYWESRAFRCPNFLSIFLAFWTQGLVSKLVSCFRNPQSLWLWKPSQVHLHILCAYHSLSWIRGMLDAFIHQPVCCNLFFYGMHAPTPPPADIHAHTLTWHHGRGVLEKTLWLYIYVYIHTFCIYIIFDYIVYCPGV